MKKNWTWTADLQDSEGDLHWLLVEVLENCIWLILSVFVIRAAWLPQCCVHYSNTVCGLLQEAVVRRRGVKHSSAPQPSSRLTVTWLTPSRNTVLILGLARWEDGHQFNLCAPNTERHLGCVYSSLAQRLESGGQKKNPPSNNSRAISKPTTTTTTATVSSCYRYFGSKTHQLCSNAVIQQCRDHNFKCINLPLNYFWFYSVCFLVIK